LPIGTSAEEVSVLPEWQLHKRLAVRPAALRLDPAAYIAGLAECEFGVDQRMFEKSWQIKTHGADQGSPPAVWKLEWGKIVGEI
jgi:hypothetical protein